MAKISKTVVDKDLRNRVFSGLFEEGVAYMAGMDFVKINDRQYGVLIEDMNGVQRYCRIGVIVAEEREDMTAEELMQKEIDEYNAKQEAKAEKAEKAKAKAAKDKAKRAKEKEEAEKDDENQFLPREVTV